MSQLELIRKALPRDIPALSFLRSKNQEDVDFWFQRIKAYLAGIHNPQQSLRKRVIFVAEIDGKVVGFIAGQLTRRYKCQGELQWLDVATDFRRQGIASRLTRALAKWFIENNALKVLVDTGNEEAKAFYAANGATELNQYWMYWEDISVIV